MLQYDMIIMMLIGQIFVAGLCERKWSLRSAQCTHTRRIGAEFSWLTHASTGTGWFSSLHGGVGRPVTPTWSAAVWCL